MEYYLSVRLGRIDFAHRSRDDDRVGTIRAVFTDENKYFPSYAYDSNVISKRDIGLGACSQTSTVNTALIVLSRMVLNIF